MFYQLSCGERLDCRTQKQTEGRRNGEEYRQPRGRYIAFRVEKMEFAKKKKAHQANDGSLSNESDLSLIHQLFLFIMDVGDGASRRSLNCDTL